LRLKVKNKPALDLPSTFSISSTFSTVSMNQNYLKISLELIWWVLTALVVWAVLHPINQAMYVWPFRTWNIIAVILLITLSRYTFLLKHTFLAHLQVLKIVVMLCMIPLCFILIERVNKFLTYIEQNTWEPLTGHLPASQQPAIQEYIWGEMLFFSVGSVVAAGTLAVRLMISVWRTRNRGTV